MKPFIVLLSLTAGSLMAQNPAITEILNNYGLINSGTVAQGAIFIVKGSNLADVQVDTLQSPPSVSLNGVEIRITVNGVTTTAPLYYALNIQLAGILPSNTPVGNGTLVVVNNGKVSTPAAITVVKSAFGMLTVNGAGSGLAAVHDPSYVLLSNTNAARPAMNVVFYGSGLGPVPNDLTPPLAALTDIPITVTIGGVNATVLYHGRTIYPGLDQINVTIPTLQAYNCTVAVVITTNGVQANAGTIPVTQSGTTCQQGGGNGGGGNPGSDITQEEINRWISQGSYSIGSMGLARSTSYLIDPGTGQTTIQKNDTFTAGFSRVSGPDLPRLLRGEYPSEFAFLEPRAGQCGVYTGIQANPFPQLNFAFLDAGPSITANGPNGAQVATRRAESGTISYVADNVPNNYLASGRYTLTGNGGPDVGAFNGTLDVPPEFIVLNNPDDFKTITRSSPPTIRWSGGDSGSLVQIQGTSFSINAAGVPQTTVVFTCWANNSAGQFTVPANILTQLPASGAFTPAPGFSILFRGTISIGNTNLGARISIPNVDYGAVTSVWSWGYAPEYK